MEILRAVERTMSLAAISDGMSVRVFDPIGVNPATTYTFAPGTHGLSPLPGEPTCDWDPCPNPDRPLDYTPPNWLPSNRDVSALSQNELVSKSTSPTNGSPASSSTAHLTSP